MNQDSYNDIINLPHHVSQNHRPMPIESRAAQFAPFAALTGYSDEVKEKARLTEQKIEIDDELKEILDCKLKIISDNIKLNPEISLTYFIKDNKKIGGKYVTVTGKIKKIDMIKQYIVLIDNKKILISDIIDIKGDLLNIIDNNFMLY